ATSASEYIRSGVGWFTCSIDERVLPLQASNDSRRGFLPTNSASRTLGMLTCCGWPAGPVLAATGGGGATTGGGGGATFLAGLSITSTASTWPLRTVTSFSKLTTES